MILSFSLELNWYFNIGLSRISGNMAAIYPYISTELVCNELFYLKIHVFLVCIFAIAPNLKNNIPKRSEMLLGTY